jgi:hypothetical protein
MALAYKVLGQSSPAANTATSLYTVPSAREAIVNTLTVCNRANAAATYRIAVRPAGASLANQHYVIYDNTVGALDTVQPDITLSLAATDVLEVYGSTNTISFMASGVEIS